MADTLGPLGLLPTVENVKRTVLAKLKYIEEFDIEVQKKTYVAKGRCEAKHIDTVARELKRFLSLPLLVEEQRYPFVPSEVVDGLWHRFIIHTRDYRTFCDEIYGEYYDHNPEGTRSAGLAKYSGEIYGYTKQQLAAFFGYTPPFVWGADGWRCDGGAPCITFG